MQIFNFIQGWTNFVLNLENDSAKEKAKICLECDYLKKGKIEIIKDNEIKEISGFICGKCKCPLPAKLRSNSKCPLNKF